MGHTVLPYHPIPCNFHNPAAGSGLGFFGFSPQAAIARDTLRLRLPAQRITLSRPLTYKGLESHKKDKIDIAWDFKL
jgi:hypothetical protein